MAQTTNFAENKSLEKLNSQLRCTAAFFGEVKHELIFLLVVNISVSITAFLGNTLILVALKKESSLHPPSKLLYRNLAITGLCVGAIAEPVYVAYFMSVLSDKWDICFYSNYCRVIIFIGCNKRGQTSRPVTGAEIQTSCNFEKNTGDPNCWLDFVHCGCIGLPLGSYCDVMVHQGSLICLSRHLICLLREDFLHSAS